MNRLPRVGSRRLRRRMLDAIHALTALVGALAVALAVTGASGGTVSAATSTSPDDAPESFIVDVPESPGADATIPIDVDLYLPWTGDRAPAVLLAHGFGGSKASLAADAERMRDDGFVVITYSARGFGESGGRISLDSIDYEVADAGRLVDVLAERPEVETVNGDPIVGVYGPSYGGALALMLGATDPRIDTVVASVTWNDLAQALVPRATSNPSEPGIFKQAWATQLFGAAADPLAGPCGRFTAEFCALYTKLVAGGALDSADEALLAASSPSSVLDGMTAPTLLLQGRQDTLFGFDQSDANARQIAAAGAPVTVAWFAGGHDAGLTEGSNSLVDDWVSEKLRGEPVRADDGDGGEVLDPDSFQFTVPASARGFEETRVAEGYPGLDGDRDEAARQLELRGRPGIVINPPGGLPATISSLPGAGSVDTFLTGSAAGIAGAVAQPAQMAGFGRSRSLSLSSWSDPRASL